MSQPATEPFGLDEVNTALADLETALTGSIVLGLAHEGEAGRIREIASGEFAPAEPIQTASE